MGTVVAALAEARGESRSKPMSKPLYTVGRISSMLTISDETPPGSTCLSRRKNIYIFRVIGVSV